MIEFYNQNVNITQLVTLLKENGYHVVGYHHIGNKIELKLQSFQEFHFVEIDLNQMVIQTDLKQVVPELFLVPVS